MLSSVPLSQQKIHIIKPSRDDVRLLFRLATPDNPLLIVRMMFA